MKDSTFRRKRERESTKARESKRTSSLMLTFFFLILKTEKHIDKSSKRNITLQSNVNLVLDSRIDRMYSK